MNFMRIVKENHKSCELSGWNECKQPYLLFIFCKSVLVFILIMPEDFRAFKLAIFQIWDIAEAIFRDASHHFDVGG